MAFEHENTPYGSYGEFEDYPTADWTAEDWAAYDAEVAADMAEADRQAMAEQAHWEAEAAYWDDDPNPYHGDYSEM